MHSTQEDATFDTKHAKHLISDNSADDAARKSLPQELVSPDFQGSTRCRLLELPPELRNAIYEYTLSQGTGGVVIKLGGTKPETRHPFGLTETCKQIHQDCGDMIYRLNTFTFHTNIWGNKTVPSNNFDFVLAKQMATNKLQSLRIHLGDDPLTDVPEDIRDCWRPVQSSLRKLRKNVPVFELAFSVYVGQSECVIRIANAPNAVDELRKFWTSIPRCYVGDDHRPSSRSGTFDHVLRSFFPFWAGRIM
ncbi:uncharacterized protein RCC_05017 [Ramularia collo-cygni]|uniref:Uncharacterized protein n=1 Tax=Ramularia collo-cygni TaxID=112498 RepID=A0A2D3USE4_9PEZI|nr:uncharacterized protein RCC_05017 [Ramularia collo-cygni]CZT19171.1 uncharacterized protein RCC_05017 [Ramularia collo-cygni]